MSHILPKTLTEEPLKATGIHLGIRGRVTKDMERFVTGFAPSGNPIIDVNAILTRLDSGGKFIVKSENAVLYATDAKFVNALKSFHEATLIPVVYHRFMPGCLTNAQSKYYIDANVLIVADPTNGIPTKIGQALRGDRRAIQEAGDAGIPVIAVCNTNATLEDVDFCIPANNAGAKAIATIFYLLARSIQLEKGWIKPEEEVIDYTTKKPLKIEDFETKIEEPEEDEEENVYKPRPT
jgi:small subunit ribosomal protein S2